MRILWRIASDTPDYVAHDLSGRGAEITGGRWNRKGVPVVYAATTASLAALETIVHFAAAGLPLNRFLVRIDLPDDLWAARRSATAVSLDVGWNAVPAGKVSLDFGDAWLKAAATPLVLEVPSVIVPEESNVLLNPRHPGIARVRATKLRLWQYDGRLIPRSP
jgi:RES domain-containing protein